MKRIVSKYHRFIPVLSGMVLLVLGAGCIDGSSTTATRSNSAGSICNIKGNISSSGEKIYHMPDDEYYDETVINLAKGELWFCSSEEAEAAGWRHAMSESEPNEQSRQDSSAESCNLPSVWGEVNEIFKKCNLKEIEKGSGYSGTFNPEGGNGFFDYCDTLIYRRYTTVNGDLYTYEKIRGTHYPNSEVGEYRMPKDLYDRTTNQRHCEPQNVGRLFDLTDNQISSYLMPSRNYRLGKEIPNVGILPYSASGAIMPSDADKKEELRKKNLSDCINRNEEQFRVAIAENEGCDGILTSTGDCIVDNALKKTLESMKTFCNEQYSN